MITLEEILGSARLEDLPAEIQSNLWALLPRLNRVRAAYGKPMRVSSGLRTMEHHLAIYRRKGIKDPKRVPMKSQHLKGGAADIADGAGELQAWVLENVPLLEEVGLWCEDFKATPTWVHFQIVPPRSGKRFFMP